MSDHPIPPSPEAPSEDVHAQAEEYFPTPTAEEVSPSMEEITAPAAEKNGESVEGRAGGMRRYRRGEVEIDAGDNDGEILVVSVKLRSSNGGGGGRRRAIEPEEPETRSKVNRFASKPASLAPMSGSATANPSALPDDPAAPPPGAPRAKFTPRTAQGAGASGKTAWEGTALPAGFKKYTILTLVLLGVGFMAGRRFGHPAAVVSGATTTQNGGPAPKLTNTWAPGRLAQLDAILAADERGDLKGARQLVIDLKKDVPDSPELDWYLTTIQVRLNEFKIPENDLARTLDAFTPPREASAINERLGFLYARHRDFARAVLAFSDAASTDPFNPMHFQHLAEAERRQGHLQDAIDHFRQALLRLPVGTPSNWSRREEIGLKIRLAQIEMGKDQDVKTEMDTQLRSATPNGYWCLTAAGYGLQHNDTSLAVSSLQKARATLAADDYSALTNDYFFHSFSGGPDVAGLLPSDTPAARVQPFQARMGYFIDP